MSRYIDADKLKEVITANDYLLIDHINSKDRGMFTVGIMQAIDEQPTADVEEVVRCKYCKHNAANWEHDELDATDYTDIVCDYWMSDGLEPDDWCSYGERRERE